VLTNAHVTENGRRFRVVLNDGREYAAHLRGDDPISDLSVLQIEAPAGTTFGYARFAERVDLKSGDSVLAMGAPWGMRDSLSAGVVNNPQRLMVNKATTVRPPDNPRGGADNSCAQVHRATMRQQRQDNANPNQQSARDQVSAAIWWRPNHNRQSPSAPIIVPAYFIHAARSNAAILRQDNLSDQQTKKPFFED
jgi:hypothetical protein